MFDVRGLDFRMSRPWLGGESSLGLLRGKHQLLGAVCLSRGTFPLIMKTEMHLKLPRLMYMKLLLHTMVSMQRVILEDPLIPPYYIL